MSVKEVVLTLNGQNYALRKNTEGEYEAVITACLCNGASYHRPVRHDCH